MSNAPHLQALEAQERDRALVCQMAAVIYTRGNMTPYAAVKYAREIVSAYDGY